MKLQNRVELLCAKFWLEPQGSAKHSRRFTRRDFLFYPWPCRCCYILECWRRRFIEALLPCPIYITSSGKATDESRSVKYIRMGLAGPQLKFKLQRLLKNGCKAKSLSLHGENLFGVWQIRTTLSELRKNAPKRSNVQRRQTRLNRK